MDLDLPLSRIDRVYFRSSDIEFWSVDSIAGIDDCMSAYYGAYDSIPENLNTSVQVELLDIPETFVFEPGLPSSFDIQNKVEFEKKTYNLAGLDIGGGPITFEIDGVVKSDLIEAGTNSSGFDVIDRIIQNGNTVDSFENGIIGVDGAMFIPFEPTDFNNFDKISKVTVDVTRDMNDLLIYDDKDSPGNLSDDGFRMKDRVEGTCFDFKVDIIVTG